MRKRIALVTVMLGLTLTACSKGMGDSPVSNGGKGDDTPAAVTNFPNHFENVATKCVFGAPGFRAFVSTRNAPPVIKADPKCRG